MPPGLHLWHLSVGGLVTEDENERYLPGYEYSFARVCHYGTGRYVEVD